MREPPDRALRGVGVATTPEVSPTICVLVFTVVMRDVRLGPVLVFVFRGCDVKRAPKSSRATRRRGLGLSACLDDLVVRDPRVLKEMFLVRCDDGLLPAFTGESPDRFRVLPNCDVQILR